MTFPGFILSFWYDILSGARMTRGQAGINAFQAYLTGGTNPIIRFYIAGTTGWGHQNSSANLIRRICQPVGDSPIGSPGFGYAGTVEAYIDNTPGNRQYDETRGKMIQLLGLQDNGDGPYQLHGATLRFFHYDPAHPPANQVNLGFTGGADPDYHYAGDLNTAYFLRVQPFRWQALEEVQFVGTRWPYVSLGNQYVLGYHTFEERAYLQPVPVPNWEQYGDNQQAQILRWLTDPEQLGHFDFCPVYSIRFPGTCELGIAGEALIQTLGGVLAAEQAEGGIPAVVVNLDVYEPPDGEFLNGWDCVRSVLTNDQDWYVGGDDRQLARRTAYGPLNAAARLDRFVYDPTSQQNLQNLQQKIAEWLLAGDNNRVLYIQLGRSTARIPPELFAYAFSQATLPSVFEGQNTANLALNIGRPYFHVNRPRSRGTEQYPSDILSEYDVPRVARQLQEVADQISLPLSWWPLEQPNPLTVISGFVRTWRIEGANGQYHQYFAGMRAFYNTPTNDKFNISVCFLNYLINGKAQAARRALAATADEGDTLAAIYSSFSQAVAKDPSVVFRQQLDPGSQIAKFIADVEGKLGSSFVTANTKVSADKDPDGNITKVAVTGNSNLFGTNVQVGVNAEFSAPDGVVVLTCRYTGDVDWRPDGMPWIGFASPYIEFTVADADLLVAGKLGGRLVGPDIDFYAVLPPNDGKILFVGDFVSPPSIDKFYQMAGGVSLVALLPPPLNILAQLELSRVEFAVNGLSIDFFAFFLNWQAPEGKGWQLVPNVTMNELDVLITVTEPGRAGSVRAVLTGKFAIGDGINAGIVEVQVSVPDLSFNAQLVEGEILLTDLLGIFLPGVTLNPPSQPVITQFTFNGYQKTGDFSLSCQLGFDWNIPSDSPILKLESIGLAVDRAGGQVIGQLMGTVTLLPDDQQNALTLNLVAAYLGKENGWQFSGSQASDSQSLSLVRLMAKYLGGWQPPDDYGINGIHFSAMPEKGAYTIGCKTAKPWTIPFIDPGDSPAFYGGVELSYDPAQPVKYSGQIQATLQWKSIEIDLACIFGSSGYTYTLDWGHFHAQVQQNDQKQWMATGRITDLTLGQIIEDLVSFATGSKFGLSAPWDLLNSVSLDGFELTFNFSTKQVGFNIPIGTIDLGFCRIWGISVTYDPDGEKKVLVSLKGSFMWQKGDTLDWDATQPDQAPTPPGGGNELLDLRLLALGQQVGIVGAGSFTTVQQVIDALRNLDPKGAPISGPNDRVKFDPDSSWLVGLDFGLLKIKPKSDSQDSAGSPPLYTISLSIVFNDPDLYALRLALAGPAAKVLDGLDFEVLYRRISDNVGVYQIELTLPTLMRQINVGAYSITLPVIGVAIYTNGDFTIDFGFPWNIDFSRSFTVQGIVYPGIPLLGSGGFYFGKLSSETSTQVPKADNGRFDPVIIFGIGAQLGIGKYIQYGILNAGFSLTAFGILEGVIAKWCPNTGQAEPDPGSKDQLQDSYYFWLQGTFGIIGKLFGSVDFAIVKAGVDVDIKIYAQITYESFSDIPISVVASVDASAWIKIDLGIFSIKIHFSFSLTIKETFTIKNSGGAPPWHVSPDALRPSLAQRHRQRLKAARLALYTILADGNVTFTWTNLAPAASKQSLEGYLAPALTVSGDMATKPSDQKVCYVAVLAIKSSDPTKPRQPSDPDTSFDLLARQVLRWMVAASLPAGKAPYSASQIDDTAVTDDDLEAILSALGDPSSPMPVPPDQIDTFMADQFILDVSASPPSDIDAAPFPVSPKLRIAVPDQSLNYAFGDFNSTSPDYLQKLRTYFNDLEVKVQEESQNPSTLLATAGGPAVGTFVFADYFRLIGKQMLEAARDALRNYKYSLTLGATVGGAIKWVSDNSGGPFTAADLLEANASHPFAQSQAVTIRGAWVQAQQNSTFKTIAGDQYHSYFTPESLAAFNHDSVTLLQPGAKVEYPGKPAYTVGTRESLDSVATKLGVTLDDLLKNAPGILDQQGLVAPLAVILLPDFKYTTGSSDSPSSVAQLFDIATSVLGIEENYAVAFSDTPATLDLPHLGQLKVGPLLDDVTRTNGLSRISGMAGRYAFHGLRLPTDGVMPNQPCACDTSRPLCGLYALTGQQFALPDLPETASFSFSLKLPDAQNWWISFDGKNELLFSIKSGDPQDSSWAKVRSLQAFFSSDQYKVAPPGTLVGPEQLYRDQPSTWPAKGMTLWQALGSVVLPYGQAPPAVPTLRMWALPDSLFNLFDEKRAAPPTALPMLGSYDEATGKMTETPLAYYGWATKVGLSIKKVSSNADTPSSSHTYELVGSGENDIVLLERLLSFLKGDSSPIGNLTLLYAPDPNGGAPRGVQSDNSESVTMGILQANLSTETHPPSAALQSAAAPSSGFLNTNYDFVKLLWECSITRSGGYYLYYFNTESGEGFPDRIFNDKGEAKVDLLVLLEPGADRQNLIPGFVNCLVTGESFNAANATVYAKSAPQDVTYKPTPDNSLSEIAYRYYMDPVALAECNPGATLSKDAKIVLTRGLYVVSAADPGEDPSKIAQWFGTTLAELQAANPQVPDWTSPLPTNTALRLPELAMTIGSSPGGQTLESLAAYYGTDVAGIVDGNLEAKGILDAGNSLAVPGGPVSRNATVPPGCIGISAIRTPPQPPGDPGNPDFARLFIQEKFVLLEYSLLENPWFGKSNTGLPISHASTPDEDSAADRTRTPVFDGDAAWEYKRTVPVSKFAGNKSYFARLNLPTPSNSPYLGIGGLARIDLRWVDVFGNAIIGQLADSLQENSVTLPAEYADRLIGVSQWPAVSVDYQVLTPAGGEPTIRLTFSLDPTPYSPGSETGTAWQDNAKQALRSYEMLYYQLSQMLGPISNPVYAVTVTLGATLLPNSDLTFVSQRTELMDWLFGSNGIYEFLVQRSQGNTSATPPSDISVDWTFTLADLNPSELFELSFSMTLSRPPQMVNANLLNVPGFATSVSQLAAHQDDNSNGTRNLGQFAQNLEACLQQPNEYCYKLMSGIDRNHVTQTGKTKPLWLVRLGLADGQAVSFQIEDQVKPVFYSPRPLYNKLQSRTDVPVYDYKTGSGIDFTKPSNSISYAGIDLDVWMRRFLVAIDNVFSPEFLGPAALVDKMASAPKDCLSRLRKAKTSLAESLSNLVIPAYDGQSPISINAAQETFKQQALVALSNAYAINAVVQLAAQVDANISDPLAKYSPILYGILVPGKDSDPGVSVATAKLALSDGSQPITFTISTAGKDPSGAVESSVTLDLSYRGRQIEHQIAELPAIEDYKASSWLSFVLPLGSGGPLDASLGKLSVPLPLRVFPSSPSMISQQAALAAPKPHVTLEELIQWNYNFVYSEDFHYPQDKTYFTVKFNVEDKSLNALYDAADPFPSLAEFTNVYPTLQNDLIGILAGVTEKSDQSTIDNANIALDSFIQLVEHVASALVSFVAPELKLKSAGDSSGRGQDPYSFIVVELTSTQKNPDGQPVDALMIKLEPLPPEGIGEPVVLIDGYTAAPSKTADGYTYLYTDKNGNYLPAATGQAIPRRAVSLPSLDILAAQCALASSYIKRNADLANPFVYQTDDVVFPTALRPTLNITDEIDIASVGSSEPVKRTLSAQLNNLFNNLFQKAPTGPQTIQVTASYRISINDNLSEVATLPLPVYFMPPTQFQPSEAEKLAGDAMTQDQIVALLNSGIFAWFANGPSAGGTLVFSLSVMTSTQGEGLPPMPLLVLENLVLNYADWSDHPYDA